jgi:dTDP-4-amino-4,6-dideoxygalactose transaminase
LCKEIGGYFELETYGAEPFHQNAILLNSARNALRYVIRAYGIETLNVPYYTCAVVWDAVKSENCEIVFYDIDEDFMPNGEFDSTAYILVNNYFGICGDRIKKLLNRYTNLIVDNAQSFFSRPQGLASFYSPRKFFGLPDGGMLFCERKPEEQYDRDVSFERMSHLLKRRDLGANLGYSDFKENELSLAGQPIKEMSELTRAVMGNIDYEKAIHRRGENFGYLKTELDEINELKINGSANAPMAYPLLSKKKQLRQKLLENKIYVARYWEGIEHVAPQSSRAVYLRDNLLPLPVDQRYTAEDMERIVGVVKGV